jgi:periplasmic copper chaperone A
MPPHRRSRLATALLVAALPLTACGEDAPSDSPGDEVVGGNAEPDEVVSEDLTVADVELAHPADDVYEAGEDAELYAAITNTGTEAVTLTAVEGPDFSDASASGADGGNGGEGLGIEVPENDNVYIGAENEPSITLMDLQESLRTSQSIPVTFVFDNGEEVTIEALVASQGSGPSDADFSDPAEDPTG